MGYKAVINDPSYLCHFNKNHDPKNGRFTFKKAWETIDTAVGKGYDAVEKVAKGAYRGIKKEFKNPSNADFNGYSTPKTSAAPSTKAPTEEKLSESFKSPDSFKTPELDEKNKIVAPIVDKLNNITKLPWLFNEGVTNGDYKSDAIQKWGKEYVDAADIGLKACKELNLRDAYGPEITNLDRSWFVLEDQTFGMAQVAYLASIGKTNKEINSIISANNDLEKANTEYTNQAKTYEEYLKIADTEPYKTNWYLYNSSYQGDDATSDEYINKCIEIANESKAQHSVVVDCGNYLVHYNKNHSKVNGQFTSGDGDSDGVVDDHHNYKKNKITNPDGTSVRPVSKKLSKYTGPNGAENLKKDGFYKVADALSKEYGRRYKNGFEGGKNTQAADAKFKKKDEELTEELFKRYKEKGKEWGKDWDQEIQDWYNKSYEELVNEDRIEYGRAWMRDIGILEADADVINKFLGKY